MNNWNSIKFTDTLGNLSVSKKNQIKSSEIKKLGKYPVVDQGKQLIAGYCDQEKKIINPNIPHIIFGDHTRIFKYIDFPYVIGADGTKVLVPKDDLFDPKFYYYCLKNLNIQNRGYNRHYSLLKEKYILQPPKPIQNKIAFILSLIQKAIEEQEKIIETTMELKKSLMQKLFTEGLNSEPQKQTEIGLIPESWELLQINDISIRWFGGGTPSTKISEYWNGDIAWITSKWLSDDLIIKSGEKFITQKGVDNSATHIVPKNSLIFATRVGVGKIGITDIQVAINQDLAGCSVDLSKYNPQFIAYQFLTSKVQTVIESYKRGATIQGITRENLKNIHLAFPKNLREQESISKIFITLDSKRLLAQKKIVSYQDLFDSMLHQLMSGKLRVDNINLN